jgi:hypothetical protein
MIPFLTIDLCNRVGCVLTVVESRGWRLGTYHHMYSRSFSFLFFFRNQDWKGFLLLYAQGSTDLVKMEKNKEG